MLIVVTACTKETKTDAKIPRAVDPARGRRIYLASCTSCHNGDPSKDGSIGPAIQGSSQALLEAKVLYGKYPPGTIPKRKSISMPNYSYLKSEVPHLAAFLTLNRLKQDQKEQVENQRQDKARPKSP